MAQQIARETRLAILADYERGVRTFQTKWWSNGQVVERIFQAPDR